MAKKKTRDSAYYRERLRKEHPAIHADLLAKKYKSTRQAAAAARLIHLPTRLDALKRDWNRATAAEQVAFLTWLKASRAKAPTMVLGPIADLKGRLRKDVRDFLTKWIAEKRSKPGRIMKEMGLSLYDITLSGAIDGHTVRKQVIDRLGPWLIKNGFR